MKIAAYIILFIFALSSCTRKRTTGFEIKGDINSLHASWVYLQVMNVDSPEHPKWIIIDSAKCKNGKFTIASDSTLPEPSWGAAILYRDSTGKINQLVNRLAFFNPYRKSSLYGNFDLENGKTSIHGNLKSKGLVIEGSPETDFDFKYGLMEVPFRVYRLNDSIRLLQDAGDTTSLKYKLYKHEYYSVWKNYKQFFISVIKHHPDRYLALDNIYNNRDNFTVSELEQMAGMMNHKIMESPTGKKLDYYIKQQKLLLAGNVFPDFDYKDTSDKEYNLKEVKGSKASLIIFWASWCGPCRREIPALKKLYDQYHSKGLAMISISIDDNIRWWKKAVKEEKMPWLNLSNLPGGDYRSIMRNFNLSAVPTLYLLNDSAKVVIGGVHGIDQIKERISDLLSVNELNKPSVFTGDREVK